MTKVYSKIDSSGNISWYREGANIYHREDGPAIEYANGTKEWLQNGKFHREDGPAVEYWDGYKYWYQNNKIHKEDGPAIIMADGYKEYWLNDIWHPDIQTDEEWIIFQIVN